MHGLTIDPSTAAEINTMAIKGAGKEGAWKSIETLEKIITWNMTSTVEFLNLGCWAPRQIVIKYKTTNI